MSEKNIKYMSRDFNTIKSDLISLSKQYYPELSDSFNDGSVGSWIIDLVSSVGDELNYYIDRCYNEQNINSAALKSSVLNFARMNGMKIPGPKAATCEIEISVTIPGTKGDSDVLMSPDWDYAPKIARGATVTNGSIVFEITEDVDFGEQFNSDAVSNRRWVPVRNSQGSVTGYTVTKNIIATAGRSMVYKKVLTSSEIEPFMEFVLPFKNVMEIEGVIFKETSDLSINPDNFEFFVNAEKFRVSGQTITTYKYFEVDSLSDQYIFGQEIIPNGIVTKFSDPHEYLEYDVDFNRIEANADEELYVRIEKKPDESENDENDDNDEDSEGGENTTEPEDTETEDTETEPEGDEDDEPENIEYEYIPLTYYEEIKKVNGVILDKLYDKNGKEIYTKTDVPFVRYYKGSWMPLMQKYITEYTDNGFIKLIFGSGTNRTEEDLLQNASNYAQYRLSKMVNNDLTGILPKAGWTMYILYRDGGGVVSNLSPGAINQLGSVEWTFNKASETTDLKTYNTNKKEIIRSVKVTNTTQCLAGVDAPSVEEIKYLTKYNNSAQNRCVTLKDYELRLKMMPSKYGGAYRSRAIEENNKILLYVLGLTSEGTLTEELPDIVTTNMCNYLTHFKSLGDFVEIRSGNIYNIQPEVSVFVDKTYNIKAVVDSIMETVYEFFNVDNRTMGEDIFIGDLEKQISSLDGVANLIGFKLYTIWGNYKGRTLGRQAPVPLIDVMEENRKEINLLATNKILSCDAQGMYEIQNPKIDIKVKTAII